MSIAKQKLDQNIAEYILFVWQMEDLVRAMYFETEAVEAFIKSYTPSENAFEEEKKWFTDLIRKMRAERVEIRGHISEIHELLFELSYLHNTLINVLKEKTYIQAYRQAQPYISDYLTHSDGKSTNDVETCLTALYCLLMLRLKKDPISPETTEAMNSFSQLMARLAHHYKLMKSGEMNFALN
jgi:Domain of unknown function (DUF4924)